MEFALVIAVALFALLNIKCEATKTPLLTSQDIKIRVYKHKSDLLQELIETAHRIREDTFNNKNSWVDAIKKSHNDTSRPTIVSNTTELVQCPGFGKLDAKLDEIKLSYTDIYHRVTNVTNALLEKSIDICLPGTPTYARVSVKCDADTSSLVEDTMKPLHELVNNFTSNIPIVAALLQQTERGCIGLLTGQVHSAANSPPANTLYFTAAFSILYTMLLVQ